MFGSCILCEAYDKFIRGGRGWGERCMELEERREGMEFIVVSEKVGYEIY